MAPASVKSAVEQRLDTGILNCWHPVLPSWAVQDTPVGITRLSRNIALWRDTEGRLHALEDRCPHRGARLSMGWNLGDRVACWYHGVEVRGDGSVAEVPASPNCPMKSRARVLSYPVREVAGAIFLYFSDGRSDDVPELVVPEELTDDEAYDRFLCFAHWKSSYRYAIDNVMDPMHGSYLHAVSHSMAYGEKSAEMAVRPTPTGFIFEKTNQMGVNFDWVEFGDTGSLWMRLTIPYAKRFGPGGPFGIIGFATPVDEKNCVVFFWRTRKVAGWKRNVWKFLYRTRLEELHWNVLEQDRMVLEDMAPEPREHEFLYQHDVGLVRVRRLLEAKAREQVEAEAAAE
ncbi:Rieske 2Fe-2S domain-containing protein [Arenibaculum sp.]|jgi:phenylpropionate dioxygenase-like ring-hydroxylating dioxygenase large terminal subunit|uniref:Rieske 2Fe-2S domain-containing protein n=1 Tax=Arenibaculum sp. TaxID=2865862 RepID=UPI002E13B97A|nr:Rieske 2Fe-2S domain-containing protein [Arenibaculum sp.]